MIKSEVGFGVDSFGKPKVLSPRDTIVQIIMNILVSKPGNIPSMPHIGIDISQYLNKTQEELSSLQLKDVIYSQCKDLLYMLSSSDIKLFLSKEEDGRHVLLVYIPIMSGGESEAIIYSFTNDDKGFLEHNYVIADIDK